MKTVDCHDVQTALWSNVRFSTWQDNENTSCIFTIKEEKNVLGHTLLKYLFNSLTIIQQVYFLMF